MLPLLYHRNSLLKFILCILTALISISNIFSEEFRGGINTSITFNIPFDTFKKRLKKELMQYDFHDDQLSVHFNQNSILGTNSYYLSSIRYPIYAFKNKASLYIELKNRHGQRRYLAISHHSFEEANLTIAQQTSFIRQSVLVFIQQLKTEAGLRKGKKLLPGYYSNHQIINVKQILDIELLTDLKPKAKNELTSHQQRVFAKQAFTTLKKEATTRTSKTKEVSSTLVQKREKYDKLHEQLSLEYDPERRSLLLLEISNLYANSSQRSKALAFAEKAYQQQPNPEALSKIHKLKGDQAYPTNRFRLRNKKRNMTLELDFKVKYDDNIVQEAVDSYFNTNTTDFSYHIGLNINKLWDFKVSNLNNSSNYSIELSDYTLHHDLDMVQQRIGHKFDNAWKNGKGTSLVSFDVGYNFFTRRSNHLLSGTDFVIGIGHYHEPQKLFFSTQHSYFISKYSDNFYESEERSGDIYVGTLSGYKTIGKTDAHRVGLIALYRDEALGNPVLSSSAYGITAEWRYTLPKVFDELKAFYLYEYQKYKQTVFGRNDVRIDEEISTGIGFSKKLFEFHKLKIDYVFTDNQSNERVHRYIRQQTSLNYFITF